LGIFCAKILRIFWKCYGLTEDGTGYASSSGRIWNTTDMGSKWEIFSITGGNDWQEDIAYLENTFLVPYSKGCSGESLYEGGGLRYSTDYGLNWKELSTGTPMFGCFLLNEERGWGVGKSASVYYTDDGGENWYLSNKGIADSVDLDDIWFIDDTTGWAVGDGVYKFKGSISVGVEDDFFNTDKIIQSISPNPIIDNIRITLDINNPSSVAIKIFNITGIEVFNRDYGIYDIGQFDLNIDLGQDLFQGFYILQVIVGSEIQTEKVIKMK
jgi:hypothetical protein